MGRIIHYILWKIKNVWNHQPDKYNGYVVAYITNTGNADFSEFTWKVRTITLPLRCKGIPGSRPVSDIIIAKWKRYMSFHMNIQVYVCIYIYTVYIYMYIFDGYLMMLYKNDQKCRKKTLHTSPWISSNHPPKFRETWQLSIPISSPPANFFRSLRQARSARRPSEAKASENPRFYRGMDGNPYEILTKSSKSSWNMDEMNVFLNNYPKKKMRQESERRFDPTETERTNMK